MALEMEISDFRFVRRYLERNLQPALSLRQVDPLIRQLSLYRDLIQERTDSPHSQETNELQRFLVPNGHAMLSHSGVWFRVCCLCHLRREE